MIERGERQELAERSADVYIGKGVPLGGVSRVQLTNEIRKLHDQFWSNREGPVVDHGPLTPDQEEEFRAKRGRAADD